jgi:ribosomal-protein-alanine N-acetyltransferase
LSFILRDLRLSDLEALYRLDRICFEPDIAYSRSEIRGFLLLETAEGVAAEEEERLLGFAIGCLLPRQTGQLLTLDVHPEARRRGVGRALADEVLKRLVRAGARRLRLEVDVRNDGAIAFYKSLGFRIVRRVANYYGERRDAFTMEAPGSGFEGARRKA